jgi:hypothetical protein
MNALKLLTILDICLKAISSFCRTEYFPQALDSIHSESSIWLASTLDPSASTTIYLGGTLGDEPLLAKYEHLNMRFAWAHVL